MAAFIVAQREQHGIPHAVACRALGLSQAWFYKWRRGGVSPRCRRRERLKAAIAARFAARGGRDGSPRITAFLRRQGWRVPENTVAALMRELGLAAGAAGAGGAPPAPAGAGGGHRTWSSAGSPLRG